MANNKPYVAQHPLFYLLQQKGIKTKFVPRVLVTQVLMVTDLGLPSLHKHSEHSALLSTELGHCVSSHLTARKVVTR